MPRSIGCFLAATRQTRPADLDSLLAHQRGLLARYSNDSTLIKSTAIRVPVAPTMSFAKPLQGHVEGSWSGFDHDGRVSG